MTDRPGRFITFEGMDGSGKTTQLQLLADRLRSNAFEVIETQEPGGTAIGLHIRKILLDPANVQLCPIAEMLLYFAARAQNFGELILPAWDRGAVVLSDRFTDSTLAYQGDGRGLGKEVVLQLHDIACHGLHPDLTIYIDIDLDTGLERVRSRNQDRGDRMDEESRDFRKRVREGYLQLAREHPARIQVVDGQGSLAEVNEKIWSVVHPVLARVPISSV